MPPMIRLRFRRHFDAAHQLPYHRGQCARLHGHRYTIEFVVDGEIQGVEAPGEAGTNPQAGMVKDFADLKRLVDALLPDHRTLNAFVNPADAHQGRHHADYGSYWRATNGEDLGLENPTAENLVVHLFHLCMPRFAEHGLLLVQLRLWETPDADVSYPASPDFAGDSD